MYVKQLTQRQVVIGTLVLQTVGSILGLLSMVLIGAFDVVLIGSVYLLLTVLLLIAYLRGVDQARYAAVVSLTLVSIFSINGEFLYTHFSIAALMPMTVALLLTNSWWIIGSEVVTIALLNVRAGGTGPYSQPVNIVMIAMIIISLVLSRKVTDDAQRTAEQNERNAVKAQLQAEQHAHEAEQAQAHAEAQARELAARAEQLTALTSELTQRNEQQQQLLDLVTTLETPVIQLADHVLFAPIVGHFDSRRAKMMTDRLLHAVSAQQAHVAILDIAGVSAVDTAVAKALIETAQALRLLGCKVVVSGISAAVASTLTHLGVSLDEMLTTRSPQEALTRHNLFRTITPAKTNGIKR